MSNNESCKQINCTARSIDEEFELPEAIMQHVQSFMERKTAGRTSVLSRSWNYAWSTHPILILGYSFRCSELFLTPHKFLEFAENAMQRYIDQNIRVDKLLLLVQLSDYNNVVVSSLDKLIVAAAKLRVNIELCFDINVMRNLPAQLLEQRCLTELSFYSCTISDQQLPEILWPNLVSLNLETTYITNTMLRAIICRCPLLECLKLSKCGGCLELRIVREMHNLKTLVVDCSSSVTIPVEFGERPFLNLKRLVLKNVTTYEALFSSDFSSRFPYLEELTLGRFEDCKNIQISSNSVKFFNLILQQRELKAIEFDFPNVRKFALSGHYIPTLSLATSKQSVSEINLTILAATNVSSFLEKLRNLQQKLHHSRIYLHITFRCPIENFCSMRNVGSFPVVENLAVPLDPARGYRYCFAVMSHLLWSCRPKLVNLYHDSSMKEAIQYLYKKLIEQAKQTSINSTSKQEDVHWMYDLEEVNVEVFESSVMEWHPLQVLLDASEAMHYGAEQLRFKLKWGSLAPEYTIVKFVKN